MSTLVVGKILAPFLAFALIWAIAAPLKRLVERRLPSGPLKRLLLRRIN